MADSPLSGSDGDVRVTISSEGADLPLTVQVQSLEVTHAVNRIPVARIVLLDDDDADLEQRFALSDSDTLIPGKAIVIKAGYGEAQAVIFSGIVIRHAIKVGRLGRSQLVIECRDKAVAMTVARKCANFVDLSDSAIIGKLLAAYGLEADVADTGITWKELVQYEVSDWDFMLARAEANGMLVLVDNGKVSVKEPDVSGAAQLSVSYGMDLLSFDAELDARNQLQAVGTVAWDPGTQAIVEQSAAPKVLNAQGNLAAAPLAEVLGVTAYPMRSATPLDSGALKSWAASRQLRAALARVRGRMRFQGSAKARPGTVMEVAKVGKRFDGTAFLSSVTHVIEGGDWSCEAEIGLAPELLAERLPLAAPLASGLTAGVAGLQIGVVKKLDQDPEQQYKVQVSLPVMQAETDGVWARLGGMFSSSGFGSFFVPEIGDEVVLGFLNSDPSHPVILGALYSSKRKPPYEPSADNFTKAVVTRSMLRVEFDDDKKVITITTPANNKIVLSDDDKSILLQDQNNNQVKLSPDGILLDSPKDIVINAKGKVSVTALGNIEMNSSADLKQEATNVTSQAKVGFTAKGAASAELSATGQTTVKGAMVMIN